MIDFEKLTPEIVAAECEAAMRGLRRARSPHIVATPAAERTFANTFVALESAVDIVEQAVGPVRLHGVRRRRRRAARDGARMGREAQPVRRRARLPRGPLRGREGVAARRRSRSR